MGILWKNHALTLLYIQSGQEEHLSHSPQKISESLGLESLSHSSVPGQGVMCRAWPGLGHMFHLQPL